MKNMIDVIKDIKGGGDVFGIRSRKKKKESD